MLDELLLNEYGDVVLNIYSSPNHLSPVVIAAFLTVNRALLIESPNKTSTLLSYFQRRIFEAQGHTFL